MDAAATRIVFGQDIAIAATAPQAGVLLCDLDDPKLRPLTLLPPTQEDVCRAQIYKGAAQKLFFARRSLLRHLIAFRTGFPAEIVVVNSDTSGAPYLAFPINPLAPLSLSLSHRGPLVALAAAPEPIGIDLEISDVPQEIPSVAVHAAEMQGLARLDPPARQQAFLEIWTLKEAYLKALRTGLAREPAEIEVRLGEEIRLLDRGRPVPTTACGVVCERVGTAVIIAACVVLPEGRRIA